METARPSIDVTLLAHLFQLGEKIDQLMQLMRQTKTGCSASTDQLLLSTRTAAQLVDINQKTLERKIRAGEIPAVRLKGSGRRGRWYVHRDVLLKLFEGVEVTGVQSTAPQG